MMRRIISVMFLLLLTATALCAQDADKKNILHSYDSKEKTQIVADKLEGNYEKREVLFVGNVVMKQGDKVITCDVLKATYKNTTKSKSTTTKSFSGDLERIDAQGNVKFFQETKMLTGANAVFYQDEQKLVVTGDPVMWEEDNFVRGSRIIFYVDKNEGVVESSGKQRVTLIFHQQVKKMGE